MEKLHEGKGKENLMATLQIHKDQSTSEFPVQNPRTAQSHQKFCHQEKPEQERISILLLGHTSQFIVLCSLQYHCTS